ncbi:MAG: cation-translocating P-type ATPase [Pirellulaceae bacterium]
MSSISAPVSQRIQRDLDAGLTFGERIRLGVRLGTALAAAAMLAAGHMISWLLETEQQPVAEVLKGLAAVLVLSPILYEAIRGLWTGSPESYSPQLVSVATLAALAVGDFTTAVLVPVILSVAFFLEERSVLGAQTAIQGLKSLQTRTARRVTKEGEAPESVPAEQLRAGDMVVIRPGETIPADGLVRSGHSAIDQSSLTGESTPEDVGPGTKVLAGCTNLNGLLHIEVTQAGTQTTLAKVLELFQEAEQSKTKVLRLIENYAKYFVLGVLLIAGITLFLTRDVSRAITVLVVGCPGPFLLAGPAAMVASLAVASRQGILVKNAKFLESLSDVNSVIFDKTGTITLGALAVCDVRPEGSATAAEVLSAAAHCATASQHPVSLAIVRYAQAQGLPTSADTEAEELPGRGVRVEVEGKSILLGRATWLRELGFEVPHETEHAGPMVWVGQLNSGKPQLLGSVHLADQARPDARVAIEQLRADGVQRTTLLTGDRQAVAEHIAEDLHLDAVVAEVLPGQKLEVVRLERAAGYRVMVVGDGVNDAPALAAGDIGVALGVHGADIAMQSADIVLMTERLDRLPLAIRLARQTKRIIHQNVIVGAGLTAIMLAMASGGLISPIAGAILQNVGEAFVIFNSATLLTWQRQNHG